MPQPELEIVTAALTSQGQRSNNEDSLCHGRCAGGWYAVVADGAGGHSRGAEASQRAIRTIETLLHSVEPSDFAPDTLSRMITAAHADLQRHQVPGDAAATMHSTIVALWIDASARHALWAHVGDSRLYRIRHGLIDVVTTDDSVVQQMVQAGLITREQARHHPHKNQLVAALGIEGEVDPHAVVRPVELKAGDAYLLCSDGWWDAFEPTMIAATLERSSSPDDWLTRMGEWIEQRQSPRQDNFSAVALWAGDPCATITLSPEDTVPRMRP